MPNNIADDFAAIAARRQELNEPDDNDMASGAAIDPIPTLVAERMKIWHSNDGDAGNPAMSDDEKERRTEKVCDQVNLLDNRIADMVAQSGAGILAQLELLTELKDAAGDSTDNRDARLMEAIKVGIRNLLTADAGDAS